MQNVVLQTKKAATRLRLVAANENERQIENILLPYKSVSIFSIPHRNLRHPCM